LLRAALLPISCEFAFCSVLVFPPRLLRASDGREGTATFIPPYSLFSLYPTDVYSGRTLYDESQYQYFFC
jgi:hypothetical protein